MIRFLCWLSLCPPPLLRHGRSIVCAMFAAASLVAAVGPVRATPAAPAGTAVSVVDDHGETVSLAQPARRIVSIAPHITELLFAAGAGERVVGVTAFSNYPAAATRLPQVGDTHALDIERIASLRPDLIVVWLHGTSARQLDALKRLGLPIYYDEPHKLEDIAQSIERLGVLAGSSMQAHAFAQGYLTRLASLRAQYASKPTVTVFHQVWTKPLMTINGQHIISDVIRLCGGRNLFGDEELFVPQPTLESVILRDPEVITTASMGDKPADFSLWQAWPRMRAVQRQQLVALPGDLISRHTPRLLDGAKLLCEALDRARAKR